MTGIFKYLWVGYTSARSNLAYLWEIAARTTFMATVLFVFMRLWTAVYAGAGTDRLAGLTPQQMLWYLMMAEAIILSAPRVSVEVDEDVRTGRVAVQLLRPLSYTLAMLGKALGERVVRFAVNLAAGSAVALVLAGPIRFSIAGLGMMVIALPMAFALDVLGYLIVGMFAFWLESTVGLAILYSRLTMLLGGMLMPIDVFPAWLQPAVRVMPFSSIIYGPARTFVAPDWTVLLWITKLQVLWLSLFALMLAAIQSIAVKRLQSNGG